MDSEGAGDPRTFEHLNNFVKKRGEKECKSTSYCLGADKNFPKTYRQLPNACMYMFVFVVVDSEGMRGSSSM